MMRELAEWSRGVPWSTMLSGIASKVKIGLLSSLIILSLIIAVFGRFVSWIGKTLQKAAIVPIILLDWLL